MPEFVVETYTPRQSQNTIGPHVKDVALAADQVSEEGTEVRLTRAIFLPDEETCFYLYQSASGDAVREAVRRAGVRLERITKAVSVAPPGRPRSDAAINTAPHA